MKIYQKTIQNAILALFADSGHRNRSATLWIRPGAAQTSPIDRVRSVGTIYDGIMLLWPDRLAVEVVTDRSASGEPVEQI